MPKNFWVFCEARGFIDFEASSLWEGAKTKEKYHIDIQTHTDMHTDRQ
jgi:hypothetical protein